MKLAYDESPPEPDPKDSAGDQTTVLRIAERAVAAERSMNTYQVQIRRRESVSGAARPLELALLKYRRAPLSIYVKWLGVAAHGREIIYVKGQNDGKVLFRTGHGDLLGPGIRLAFAPESTIVRAQFPHNIDNTGFATLATRLAELAGPIHWGPTRSDSVHYLGRVRRPEFGVELECVEHRFPAAADMLAPRGGIRQFFVEPGSGLPVIVQTFDSNMQELEYYCFDRLQAPVPFDESDFDADAIWPKRKTGGRLP
jgi:hypothetical protein